jgi:hypothetical protein
VELVIAAAFVIGMAMLLRAGREDRKRRRAAAVTVAFEVDARGVRRELADGRREEVHWDEVGEVRVVRLPRGPWGERVRIVLDGGGERGCIVPWDVAEEGGLANGLYQLRGFDLQRLFAAVEGGRPGNEVLWRRQQST